MKILISEQEKREIKLLYEQSTSTVPAAKLDDLSVSLLPSEFVKTIDSEMLQNQELINKINDSFNTNITKNPLNFLTSNGIYPYLFIVPNFTSPIGEGFPTTGLSVKIDNTPFTVNLNLGTNPLDILNSLKFSQIKLSLPISK